MFKNSLNLFLVALLIVLGGCSTTNNKLIPTANRGGYTIDVVKTKSKINSGEVSIKGTVFDVNTGAPLQSPILLKVGCLKIQASSQGNYSFKTNNFNDDYFFIEVISIGYKSVVTNFLDLKNKNELIINFYLAEDDRPLIECPPNIIQKD
jgi:hypothetical protein